MNSEAFKYRRLYFRVPWGVFFRASAFVTALSLCALGLDAKDLFAGNFAPPVALALAFVALCLMWMLPTLFSLLMRQLKPSYIELHNEDMIFCSANDGPVTIMFKDIVLLESVGANSIKIWYRGDKLLQKSKQQTGYRHCQISRLWLGTSFDTVNRFLILKSGKMPDDRFTFKTPNR